tara:strand:- start:263 stop:493 length:231 start_codon:yes stop_codon:yes gene_type:complete
MMTIKKYVKDNMQEQRVYRQRLLSEALDTMCHWSFHETTDALQHSTEFYKAKQFLEQYHRGILRLYINYAHDFRAK